MIMTQTLMINSTVSENQSYETKEKHSDGDVVCVVFMFLIARKY